MTVAQIRTMAELCNNQNLEPSKRVNFTTWRDSYEVTLTFMDNMGEVFKYNVHSNGDFERIGE